MTSTGGEWGEGKLAADTRHEDPFSQYHKISPSSLLLYFLFFPEVVQLCDWVVCGGIAYGRGCPSGGTPNGEAEGEAVEDNRGLYMTFDSSRPPVCSEGQSLLVY